MGNVLERKKAKAATGPKRKAKPQPTKKHLRNQKVTPRTKPERVARAIARGVAKAKDVSTVVGAVTHFNAKTGEETLVGTEYTKSESLPIVAIADAPEAVRDVESLIALRQEEVARGKALLAPLKDDLKQIEDTVKELTATIRQAIDEAKLGGVVTDRFKAAYSKGKQVLKVARLLQRGVSPEIIAYATVEEKGSFRFSEIGEDDSAEGGE